MSTDPDRLEHLLVEDLRGLGDRLSDDRLVHDLYGALAGTALSKAGESGHLSLSWGRAAAVLNGERKSRGYPAIDQLAQSGGEGEASGRAREVLTELGWTVKRESHDRADPAHSANTASPRRGDVPEPEWKRQGDADAEAERLRRR
jgi:hypothetical protein